MDNTSTGPTLVNAGPVNTDRKTSGDLAVYPVELAARAIQFGCPADRVALGPFSGAASVDVSFHHKLLGLR